MTCNLFQKSAIAAMIFICLSAVSTPSMAEQAQVTAVSQFRKMTTLAGEWTTQEHPSLRIIFELTAGGTVVVERWMVGERMHSMTVYHLDRDALMATHYCPQGNQPRLIMDSDSSENHVSFSFYDSTNLENLEQSHQHQLSFDFSSTGQITRGEAYRAGISSSHSEMVLVRAR